jgi:septation ring formation regulator EzrA
MIFDTLPLPLPYIIMIAIGGVILVIAFIILYKTVFAHTRLKRQARDLCGKFEREHAILFGQDSQYIKRLETISSMNLVYVQQFLDWNKRFKDVRDVSDASAQAAVNSLKDLVGERKYKELKQLLPTARKTIDEYETQVDALSENLKSKFRDEDDCRTLALEKKEQYRKIKQEYYSHQSDLTLVVATFDLLFHKLDGNLEEADQDIENARYVDAKVILSDKVGPVVIQIGKVLQFLPNICLLISSVIPDKLASLSSHYDEMIQGGYPLHHILLRGDMDAMAEELKRLSEKVQNLDLTGVQQELDDMQKRIDAYLSGFDKEKEARVIFEKEKDGIYSEETALENNFINLCHALPKIRTIYLIGADEQTQVDGIQNTINKAGASKRSLDTYVHSATKQPYSILVDKMHTLRDQAAEASKSLSSFQAYLQSLKNDSEAANSALKVYSARLRQTEKAVREINLQAVTNVYVPRIQELYKAIDTLSNDLSLLPIDVKKVDADLALIKDKGDALIEEVAKAVKDMNEAETAMVMANRYRSVSGEIDAALIQAESLFYAGNFRQSYDLATNAVKNLKEA